MADGLLPQICFNEEVMKKRKKKQWAIEITQENFAAITSFLQGKIGISQFMLLTGTNQSSCYSMIARGARTLHLEGRLTTNNV